MGDDNNVHEQQARTAKNRQNERDSTTDQARRNDPKPPASGLDELESELSSLGYPTTGSQIVTALGDYTLNSHDKNYTIEELIPENDTETFDSPSAVRVQVQRPTVAAAMKQIIDANSTLNNSDFPYSQRKAYEMTFEELRMIDIDDEDDGIAVMSDWILGRIREKHSLPSSRDVRRHASKVCRANGYQIRNEDWLGI